MPPAAAAVISDSSAGEADALLGAAAAMAELAQYAGSGFCGVKDRNAIVADAGGDRRRCGCFECARSTAAASSASASYSMPPLRHAGVLRSGAPEHILGESMHGECADSIERVVLVLPLPLYLSCHFSHGKWPFPSGAGRPARSAGSRVHPWAKRVILVTTMAMLCAPAATMSRRCSP